jgi:hypothetical protein
VQLTFQGASDDREGFELILRACFAFAMPLFCPCSAFVLPLFCHCFDRPMDRSKTNCPSVIREDRIREIHVTSSGTGAAFPDLVLWNPASASGLDELGKVGVDLILVSGGQAVWRARIDC